MNAAGCPTIAGCPSLKPLRDILASNAPRTPLRDNRVLWHMIYAHSEVGSVTTVIDRLPQPRVVNIQRQQGVAPNSRALPALISVIGHFIGSLYGFGERTALSRTNLNVLSRENGGITRLLDSFLSEKLNRRHDVREVHRRSFSRGNRCAEIMLRLPGQIYAVRDAATVEQHVKQDDAPSGRLMQSSD